MPAGYPALANFNAGELSPRLAGRTDIPKYNNGCSVLENFIPLVQGPARRRSGTRFVKEVRYSNHQTFLTRFVFNETQSYILEWGEGYLRFYTNHGALLEPNLPIIAATQANPVKITTGTVHGYVTGDEVFIAGVGGMIDINDQFFTITVTAPDQFTLNGVNGTHFEFYVAGGVVGRVYTIPSPYDAAGMAVNGIFQLNIEQSGDVAYVCHANGRWPVYKLSRLGNTNWTFAPLQTIGGPFKDQDPNQTIGIYASAQTGDGITLTADADVFTAGQIGTLFLLEAKKLRDVKTWEVGKLVAAGQLYRVGFRVYKALTSGYTGSDTPIHTEGTAWDGTATTTYGSTPTVTGVNWEFEDPSYGWVRIVSITDAQNAIANVISTLDSETVGAANKTTKWAFGAWSDDEGYPTHVKFFRTRLCFARGQNMWLSEAADFEKFRNRDEGGEVTAEMAISIVIPSQDPIRWIQEGNLLLVGTSGGEHLVGEITTTSPLGPANIQSKQVLAFGGRGIPAIRIGNSILFVQLAGHKLREVQYSFQVDSYVSSDTTVLADHIAGAGFGFIGMAWQQEPGQVLWLLRDDGQLVGFTFNREQDVLGFHRHIIGGSGAVESIACIPSPAGERDELWMVVNRTINGVVRRYVEWMERDFDPANGLWNAFFVDSGQTYFGDPTTLIGGLSHLVGQTVDVLTDGSTHPQCVVNSKGQITLERLASIVQVGLPCPARLHTMRLESGAGSGTAQSKMKRITNVTIRLENTVGGKFGSPQSQDRFFMRKAQYGMDQPLPVWTGDWPPGDEYGMPYPEGYEMDAIICYEHDQPLPATIVAFYPAVQTQDG